MGSDMFKGCKISGEGLLAASRRDDTRPGKTFSSWGTSAVTLARCLRLYLGLAPESEPFCGAGGAICLRGRPGLRGWDFGLSLTRSVDFWAKSFELEFLSRMGELEDKHVSATV